VHFYVGTGVNDGASESAIVEVTPRWRDTNPSRYASTIQQLADSGAHVRITGLLLYDQEH
jgi:hypothetical protein